MTKQNTNWQNTDWQNLGDTENANKLILALPKGRILTAIHPLMARAGLIPEDAFFDADDRRLRFTSNDPQLDIIRVRSFDVATFLSNGAAQLGIAGADILMEFDHPDIYAPVDLNCGQCRMVVASQAATIAAEDPRSWSHVRVATKYPNLTRKYFAARGVQAECLKLNGALELAPSLGLCRRIVDLVESGETLRANGLVEVEEIAKITSKLAVNRVAWKTRRDSISDWVRRFSEAVDGTIHTPK